jgi:hypothetical protein
MLRLYDKYYRYRKLEKLQFTLSIIPLQSER